jgi:hypothetical protein
MCSREGIGARPKFASVIAENRRFPLEAGNFGQRVTCLRADMRAPATQRVEGTYRVALVEVGHGETKTSIG